MAFRIPAHPDRAYFRVGIWTTVPARHGVPDPDVSSRGHSRAAQCSIRNVSGAVASGEGQGQGPGAAADAIPPPVASRQPCISAGHRPTGRPRRQQHRLSV